MSGFILKAACCGRRPSQFAGYQGYQRADLITRLLTERSVSRFVVAPEGYGKTSLVLDYAETAFEWVHVFWINGKSPCFLRDLDAKTIAQDCMNVDEKVRLVVFDDVPVLDSARAQAFSAQLDELLEAGVEVVAICTPRGDMFGQLQRDRLRLNACDLLLSDEELEAANEVGSKAFSTTGRLPDACRVPALVWRNKNEPPVRFLKGILKEPMPADFLLATCSMLIEQHGSLEDLRALGPLDFDGVCELAVEYPHLGFDAETERFETPVFALADIAAAMRGLTETVVSSSAFKARDELAWAWANMLAERNDDHGRACDVVRTLCPRNKRFLWVADHWFDVVRSGCFYEGSLLAEAAYAPDKENMKSGRSACVVLGTLCEAMLGDYASAVRLAKRVAFEAAYPLSVRAGCLIVIARYGAETMREHAEENLASLAKAFSAVAAEDLSSWEALVVLWHASHQGADGLAEAWMDLYRANADATVLSITASWLYEAVNDLYQEERESQSVSLLGALTDAERFVRTMLAATEGGTFDFFAVSAALSMERAHMSGMPLAEGPLATSSLLLLRRAEVSLLSQRARADRDTRIEAEQSEDVLRERISMNIGDALGGIAGIRMTRNVPILSIRMFGRFQVMIGNEPIGDYHFQRKHVRLMLLVLAINLGRDVSRDVLAEQLWPNVSKEQARRSFYTTWSKLRRALTLPDGTCPYLLRHQYGCCLDERYVHSDIARFNDICRELLFGSPDAKGWSALYSEIDRDFSNDLLPSETNTEIVAQARIDYRGRLVDSLIAATQSLIDDGNPKIALWFARAAIGHDEVREDAHVALMRAQIANGQRTAAMMTFHACRKVLAERLGVDPSPETVALYESLLDGE